MRRSTILFAALLSLLLTACAPAATPVSTTASQPQPTSFPQPTKPAVADTPEPAKPVATPDMEKVLKPQPDDHKRGPDGAPVTIIEWGDFQ